MKPTKGWVARAANFGGWRPTRALVLIVLTAVAIFTLAGFLGVPLLLRHLARGQLAAALHRQVTVGTIRFNPYTLRLTIDHFHVGERDSGQAFSDTRQIRVKASWRSLLRLAPIIQELTIERPRFHLIRTASDRFNFSDLIAGSGQTHGGQPAPPAPGRTPHFAVSNILIKEGQVWLEDRVLHEHHAADHIQIGVPFIANLPADVDIFVQPMVRMTIDGSPFRVLGMAKPFAATPESVLDLKLKRLDLPRYAAYVEHGLPLRIAGGSLSTNVQMQFAQPESGPVIRLGGSVEVDGLDVRDGSNAPLVAFKRATVALTNVEPLGNVVSLGAIVLDGVTSNLVLYRGGATNFTALAAAVGGQPASQPQGAPFNFSLQSLELSNGAFNFTAIDTSAPTALALDKVHIALGNFAVNKQAPPVSFEAQGRLGTGALALKGTLDLAHAQIATEVSLDKIDLPSLQKFAQPYWAGTIASGTLGARAKLKSTFTAGHFNVLSQSASAALDAVELRASAAGEKPVQLARLSVAIEQFDLAARHAIVKEVRSDGLRLFARRGRDGELNLSSFLRASPSAAQAAANPGSPTQEGRAAAPQRTEPHGQAAMSLPGSTAPPGPLASVSGAQWQYRIESIALVNTDASVEDDTGPQPIAQEIAPLNLSLKHVSSDLGKPFGLELDGALKPTGSFKIDGTAVLTPLKVNVRVLTKRIDLTPAGAYVSSLLNARITRAVLSTDGALDLAIVQDKFRASYQGDATLGNLRVRDKVTNDKFLRCSALSASGIKAEVGGGQPRVHIGGVALSDFYARLILNSNGRLNLRDLVATPESAPTSLTRAKPEGGAAPAPPATPAAASALTPASGPPVDVKLGRIVLQGGSIDFTDNFIKPHYSAKLTDVAGKIGSFGTRSTQPAAVELQGQVNASAPIDISGSLSPLAPRAYVDLKANANGVELSNLTPYSTKYTGYPITRGTLNVDVHYLLDNGKLTANNHFFIDQLTFGDRVESPSAINLPIALAVSLLKNSRGEIDVTIPVSGALSDPQFSISAAIFQAFSNLILKIVSSPFTLLASAAGASNQQLDLVEFAPGLATLNPGSEKRLATLSKALQDRPALRLGICGRVDPRVDRDGLRAAMVQRRIKAQKVKDLRDQGEIADADSVQIAPDEYDKYLAQAYKKAKFPKPSNVLGLTKSLPPEEMKKLMLTNTEVTDEDLRELASARALAVRRWLSKQIDPVRLVVVAPRLNADGIKDQGKTTRVDLSIE